MNPLRNFGFLLKDISRLFSLNFERHATELSLNLTQCRVLCYIEANEGITQVRLAYLSDTDPMTLVRILNRMEEDGLIERRDDPADRRTRCLFLRAPAFPLLEEIWRHSDCARAETLSGLSAAERVQLVKLMQRVHANLDALVPGAADTSGIAHRQPRKYAQMRAEAEIS